MKLTNFPALDCMQVEETQHEIPKKRAATGQQQQIDGELRLLWHWHRNIEANVASLARATPAPTAPRYVREGDTECLLHRNRNRKD